MGILRNSRKGNGNGRRHEGGGSGAACLLASLPSVFLPLRSLPSSPPPPFRPKLEGRAGRGWARGGMEGWDERGLAAYVPSPFPSAPSPLFPSFSLFLLPFPPFLFFPKVGRQEGGGGVERKGKGMERNRGGKKFKRSLNPPKKRNKWPFFWIGFGPWKADYVDPVPIRGGSQKAQLWVLRKT